MHPVSEVFGMLSHSQLDPLTGLLTRPALLATLFRETDRVQRSKHPLSLALFSIADFKHWTARLTKLQCDALLKSIAERVGRQLRSYDTFGHTGDHEFLLLLPGCSAINSNLLAERLRAEVFSMPVNVDGESLRLSACFGIASSEGRSPMVVLREAELALRRAQEVGPGSIRTFTHAFNAEIEPIGVSVLIWTAGGGLLRSDLSLGPFGFDWAGQELLKDLV